MMAECDFNSTHYPQFEGDLYLDQQVLDALEFMNQPGKWCLTVHMDPDYYGHVGGPESDRYKEEICRCDDALGQLLARCNMSHTVVCVLADHGFDSQDSGPPWVHFAAPDGACMIYGMPVKDVERMTSLDFFPTITSYIETERYPNHPVKRGRSLLV
jgi:phosphopentomutase